MDNDGSKPKSKRWAKYDSDFMDNPINKKNLGFTGCYIYIHLNSIAIDGNHENPNLHWTYASKIPDLAKRVHMGPHSMAKLLKKYEDKGYIAKRVQLGGGNGIRIKLLIRVYGSDIDSVTANLNSGESEEKNRSYWKNVQGYIINGGNNGKRSYMPNLQSYGPSPVSSIAKLYENLTRLEETGEAKSLLKSNNSSGKNSLLKKGKPLLKQKNPIPTLSQKRERENQFLEFFKKYRGRKESKDLCKTRFMEQIVSDDDLAEFDRVFEKYISAHKARKVRDMKRIRWMKSTEFFDTGWKVIADDDWMLGKPQDIETVKSPEALQEESDNYRDQLFMDMAFNPSRVLEDLEYISEFEIDNPDRPKVVPEYLQSKVNDFLKGQKMMNGSKIK